MTEQDLRAMFMGLSATQAKMAGVNWNTVRKLQKGQGVRFRKRTLKKWGVEEEKK